MSKTQTTTKISSSLLIFGIPLLIISSMILIASSKLFQNDPHAMSIGLTIDLLFTAPIIYFFLIKKKNIPKITMVPFFVLGLVVASNIIPKEHQSLLSWIKTWIFPLVELGIGVFAFYKVRQTLKQYRENAKLNPDFFSTIKGTCTQIFPNKVGVLLTMELAVFYYGFIYWKKKILAKNEFSYYKNSGTIALLVALIFIIGIETYVLHFFLLKWSAIAAWIASVLSIYSSIQILGFLKSIMKRPIVIEENMLHLRYGILSETSIAIDDIETIEISSKDLEWNDQNRKLSPLGELEAHNMMITLKKENTLVGLYGIKKPYTRIAFFVDKKEEFKAQLEHIIQNPANL